MTRKLYWFCNLLIFIVFVGIYLIPGLEKGGWLSSYIKNVPRILVISGIAFLQFLFAFALYEFKPIIIRFLNKYEYLITKKRFYLILSLLLFTFFFTLGVKRHLNLETAIFDFSLEQQVVWNTSQGRYFESSVEVTNYLGDHVSLLTPILALIYFFLPSPFTLIAIQVAAVILAGFTVKLIADRLLQKPWLSLAIYFTYIFYIGLIGLILSDYRAVVLALPFLTYGLYLLEFSKHKKIGIMLLILAALGKEDIAIFVGTIGLYHFIVNKKKIGIFLCLFGYLLAILGVFVIIPFFRGSPSDTLNRFTGIDSLLWEVPLKVTYIFRIFFPLLFLSLLSWKKIWVLLPNLLINLMSKHVGQFTAVNQYDLVTGLIIFWAFISTMVRFQRKRISMYYIFALLLITNVFLLSGHTFRRQLFSNLERFNDYVYIQEFINKIPADSVISATTKAGGQFGHFRDLQIYDNKVMTYSIQPDYIVIDKIQDLNENIQKMISLSYGYGYIKRSETESILILQKINFIY